MHQIFRIQELLDIIFRFTASPPTLTAAAKTCRTFSEVALDVLWATYGGVDELVKLLPDDLWTEAPTSSWRKVLHFNPQRPITAKDWERFRKHNHRIRHVMTANVSLEILPRLSASAPKDLVLFPHISSLTCTCNDIREVMFLPMFITPRLRNLHVDVSFDLEPSNIEFMCSAVLNSGANLKSIHFTLPVEQHIPDTVAGIVGSFACQFPNLEDLYIPRIELSAQMARYIVSLPKLRTLSWSPSMYNLFTSDEEAEEDDTDSHAFHKLITYRHLGSQHPFQDTLEPFFSTMQLAPPPEESHLRHLALTIPFTTSSKQMIHAFKLISSRSSQHFSSLSLQKPALPIRLSRNCSTWRSNTPILLPFSVLRDFLHFKSITRLALSADATSFGTSVLFDIDDSGLDLLASSFPLLSEIGLDVFSYKVTINGFVTLLEKCRSLSTIHMTTDFIPKLADPVHSSKIYPNIRALHMKDSRLRNPTYVGELFVQWFPSLKRIWCNPRVTMDGWKDVNECIWKARASAT